MSHLASQEGMAPKNHRRRYYIEPYPIFYTFHLYCTCLTGQVTRVDRELEDELILNTDLLIPCFSCEPRKSYALKCTDDDDEMFDEKVEGTQVSYFSIFLFFNSTAMISPH